MVRVTAKKSLTHPAALRKAFDAFEKKIDDHRNLFIVY